jgi:lipopolysaccharide export system protein LptC
MHTFNSAFKKRVTFAVIATLVASSAASIVAGSAYASTITTTQPAERSYTTAITHATDTGVDGRTDYAAVSDAVARAQKTLQAAVGSPPATQNARTALSDAISADTVLLDKANSELNELSKYAQTAKQISHSTTNGIAATSRLDKAPRTAITGLHTATAQLASLEAQVSAAIAAANAPIVVAPAPVVHAAPVARTASVPASLNVWTSGFQNELNACRGAVDLTSAYGVATIGEKWGCGGSRFPAAGSVITLTGLRAGTYRVGPVAAVLNAYTQNPSDIPRGFALLFQTCRNDDAHTEIFVELTPVS